MNPDSTAELLARLTQTGRSLTPGEEGRDTSKRALSQHDIAAAVGMAKLTEVQYLALLSMYAHDYSKQNELYYQIEVKAMDIAVNQNWNLKPRLFRRMVRLAIGEMLYPARCPVCRGIGSVQASPPIPCETCNSSGWLKLSDGKRAAILEVHPSQYSRTWKPRYSHIVAFVRAIPEQALRRVADAI